MFTGVVNHMLIDVLCLYFDNHNMLNDMCYISSIVYHALIICKIKYA